MTSIKLTNDLASKSVTLTLLSLKIQVSRYPAMTKKIKVTNTHSKVAKRISKKPMLIMQRSADTNSDMQCTWYVMQNNENKRQYS